MQREAINPWSWAIPLGYNQAEILVGSRRQMICAGQTAVDAMGEPQHAGDMRGQLALCLTNLQSLLEAGGMGLGNVTKLSIFSTDVDEAMRHFDLLGQSFGALGAAPPMTLLGVTRLALPSLLIEIEALAAD